MCISTFEGETFEVLSAQLVPETEAIQTQLGSFQIMRVPGKDWYVLDFHGHQNNDERYVDGKAIVKRKNDVDDVMILSQVVSSNSDTDNRYLLGKKQLVALWCLVKGCEYDIAIEEGLLDTLVTQLGGGNFATNSFIQDLEEVQRFEKKKKK